MTKDDVDYTVTKREMLVDEHLRALSTDLEHASAVLIDEAHREADKVLGKGNDN
ncbi:hypothetical protein [Pandoraea cepalis]|uniref:hypothetical protein n=1 Tax=Pandoraea cepalis TaxID=2508294 RepID=UPI00263AD695|nr:hypothetical protein [Pandoraea cepalis]